MCSSKLFDQEDTTPTSPVMMSTPRAARRAPETMLTAREWRLAKPSAPESWPKASPVNTKGTPSPNE